MPPIDPSELAQDKDFMGADPEEQMKFLSSQDQDFAKAPREDQMGYLEHLTGKPVRPNVGLAPHAGAPPVPQEAARGMQSQGPAGRNMTSFGAQLSQAPAAMGKMVLAKHWPIIDSHNWSELGQDIKSLNPIVHTDTGETGGVDIGATAANLLPYAAEGIGLADRIPRMGRAGANLEKVTNAMRGTPVATGPVDAAAAEALLQHEHGAGALPPPIRKYIKYGGGPGAMQQFPGSTNVPFEDMRDFQSNAGRLSAKDMKAMSPKMKRQLANFATSTADVNRQAAETAGQGELYDKGINEYRRAAKMRDFGRGVAKTAIPAALGYEGYRVYRNLQNR
jgi:hypothetical protein